jgi:hypothetical protein
MTGIWSTGANFREWCGEAGLRRFDIIHLSGFSAAAIAYQESGMAGPGWMENTRDGRRRVMVRWILLGGVSDNRAGGRRSYGDP